MSFAVTAGVAGVAAAGISAASAAGAFGGGSSGGGAGGGGAAFPQYNGTFRPINNVSYNPAQIGADLSAVYPALEDAARSATRYSTKERERIFPGSGAIFEQAGNVLQSYLRGMVPQDVVDQTNRIVAERAGGSWNPFTQGGQAAPDFARSIGQTSLGITNMGLSSAPTWQQLAQSFITMPQEFAPLASSLASTRYQYDALNTGINQWNEEGRLGVLANQYNAQANQYGAQQAANFQTGMQGQQLGSTIMGAADALASLGSIYSGTGASFRAPRPTEYRAPGTNTWVPDQGYRRTTQKYQPAVADTLGNPFKLGRS